MFKNSVFKVSVNTKQWVKSASIRAIKTFFQTFVGCIGGSALISDVNWNTVISSAILSAIISIGTSLAGIPEVESED